MIWPVAPLRDVASVGSGSGFPLVHQGKSDGEFPFLKVSDMNLPGNNRTILRWNNVVTEGVRAQLHATAFPPGSVIFPKIGAAIATNKKRLLARSCCVDNNVMAIVPDKEKLDSEYLYFLLLTKNLSDFASDSNPPSMRKGTVESWAVPIPPLSEQHRIVDILARAEGIVRLRRDAQTVAASIVPALFLDMFGDPGANPKGWALTSLGHVLRAADYGSSTKASETGAGVPLIRMGNVTFAGDLDLSNLKHVDLEPVEIARYGIERGDILFNRTNSKELVGKTGLWDGELDAVAASYFIRLRVDETRVRPHYVWAFMNTRYMKQVLFDTARGAIGQANINSKELRAFTLPRPPLEIQVRFEERCRSIRSAVVMQTEALKKAEALFHALLARSLGPN